MYSNTLIGAGEAVPKAFSGALDRSTVYDHAITCLSAHTQGFVTDDQGALERCRLLNHARLLRCFVWSSEEFVRSGA